MFCKSSFNSLILNRKVRPSSSSSSLNVITSIVRKFSSRQEDALERIKKEIEEDKKKLQWRKPVNENPSIWKSKLGTFADEEQNSDFISMMQQPIDLRPSSVKKWWKNRKEFHERMMQMYLPDRHRILGSDLAVAHFIVHRGGAVRFLNNKQWIRADKDNEYDLPKKYDPNWKIEAIRCDNMELYYEGLENIRNLHNLKFWSLINVKTFDDWCLDRLSGSQNTQLEVLDLSGTNITYRGLSCVYRLDTLKVLVVDDPKISKEFELSCALLEDVMPKLKIYSATDIH